jgi:hypothetical protein
MSAWFHRLVTSHGWYALAPFAYDETSQTLLRVHQLPGTAPFTLAVRAAGDQPAWVAGAALTPAQRAEVEAAVRHMLSLHWPLDELYVLVRDLPRYRWVAEQAMGRLLVSPSVWEDLAKTLMTTKPPGRRPARRWRACVRWASRWTKGVTPSPRRSASPPCRPMNWRRIVALATAPPTCTNWPSASAAARM